jgi:hypothetical protein
MRVEEISMAFSFNSVGHFFAKAYKVIVADLPKVEGTKTVVEGVTAAAGGAAVVPIEDAAYAVLGELSAVLTAGGDAAAAKLTDAGLDVNVVNMVKQVLSGVGQVATVAKSL